MKKIFSFILIFALLISLMGCAGRKKVALVISGTEISEEIYNYYLSIITARPTDYGLDEEPSDKELKDAAVERCRRFVAISTDFDERDITLTVAEKVAVADKVNNYMLRFEKHYEKIGVSRETLNSIFTVEAKEDAIFDSMYDKGISNEKEEAIIKRYFSQNYVAFRSICAYFTDSSGNEISAVEKSALTEVFANIVSEAGTASSAFTEACNNAGYSASDIIILEKDSDGYPDGFFEKVKAQATGTVEAYEYDECIFAVRTESLDELGDGVYGNYRSTCIEDMYSDDWEEYIANYVENFTVEEINV